MPTLLISSCPRDRAYLQNVCASLGRKLYTARTRAEALSLLETIEVSLVICERNLEDSSWRDLLGDVAARKLTPPLIVVSPFADDRLWTEVLASGGYDVVAKPFDGQEIVRVMNLAWHGRPSRPHPAISCSTLRNNSRVAYSKTTPGGVAVPLR